MNLRYTGKFLSSLRKLSVKDKTTVLHAIELFAEDSFDPSLSNHAIKGRLTGKRAISA